MQTILYSLFSLHLKLLTHCRHHIPCHHAHIHSTNISATIVLYYLQIKSVLSHTSPSSTHKFSPTLKHPAFTFLTIPSIFHEKSKYAINNHGDHTHNPPSIQHEQSTHTSTCTMSEAQLSTWKLCTVFTAFSSIPHTFGICHEARWSIVLMNVAAWTKHLFWSMNRLPLRNLHCSSLITYSDAIICHTATNHN